MAKSPAFRVNSRVGGGEHQYWKREIMTPLSGKQASIVVPSGKEIAFAFESLVTAS